MSVQEAAWELDGGVRVEGNPPWGRRDGVVCVVERGTDGPHSYHDFELPPESAEARAVAYLKAAAVARGERGLTAALNRAAQALGHGGVSTIGGSARTELADRPVDHAAVVEALVGAGVACEGGDIVQGMRGVIHERDTLRDALRELRGVVEERDSLRAWLLKCGENTSATEGRPLHRIPDDVAAEMEDKRAFQAALADAIGADPAPWPALVEQVRELRDALSGRTQYDVAAEVVAPLREAMGPCLANLSPAEVVRAAVTALEAYGAAVRSDA